MNSSNLRKSICKMPARILFASGAAYCNCGCKRKVGKWELFGEYITQYVA